MPVPKQSSRPKRWHPSPDPVDGMLLGGTTSKATSEGPPSSKYQEVPPWNKVLKQSCSEVFSWYTDLVKEARKEYFKKHSYNFTVEGTCNLSEVFRQMAKSTDLLGTAIHEIQAVWMGPDELWQANYVIRVVTSRRQAESIHLSWGSKQGSPREMVSLGLPCQGHPHPLA